MPKSFTLNELAQYLEAPYEGDGEAVLTAIADLKDATPDQVSFLSDKRYESFLNTTQAGAVIVDEQRAVPESLNIIRVKSPYLAYAKLSKLFDKRVVPEAGIHPTAVVATTAKVDPSAVIGPHCVIEDNAVIGAGTQLQAQVFVGQNTVVGENCMLYAHVTLYHHVVLGDRVSIHAATVIGSDGFGYAPTPEGWVKIHQLGGVTIEDDVEIGSGTTIDRGAVSDTIIRRGVIIDNQVHVAHNCELGENSAFAGCVGMAGSTKFGKGCTVGGGVLIGGHLEIGDGVHFNGGTIVTKSILEPGQYSSGTPVQEVKLWRRNAVRQGQLSEWVDRIKKLEQSLSSD